MSVAIERLCLEESLEDTPQTRNFVKVFQDDAEILRSFATEYYACCENLYKAQLSVCSATSALCETMKKFPTLSFPLDKDMGVQKAMIMQFAVYLEEMCSYQKEFATQMCANFLGPINKFLSCDYEALNGMKNMYDMITDELEQSVTRYLKLSKKATENARLEAAEDVYQMRRKFHLSAMQYYANLNTLQYQRHIVFLDSLIGYFQTYRRFYQKGNETLSTKELLEFLQGVETNVKSIQSEMSDEASKMDSLIVSIDEQCTPLYNPELLPSQAIPDNPHLLQKSGYLHHRNKQGILGPPRWIRMYFFTQGGNLMAQGRDEVAGRLLLDLNEEGVYSEILEIDDRRNVFQIVSPLQKKTWILQAETERDRNEWIAALTNIMFEGGYVKDKGLSHQISVTSDTSVPSSQASSSPKKKRIFSLNLFNRSEDTSESASAEPNEHPLPSGYLDAVPIQFDLTTPVEEQYSMTEPGGGFSKRKNPFDDPSQENSGEASGGSFTKSYLVHFMGSVQVPNDRGESLVKEAIRHIMTSRAIHDIYRMPDLMIEVSSKHLSLLDATSKSVRLRHNLEDVSFWSTHRENSRLLAFITRQRSIDEQSQFICHVFESQDDGEVICNALRSASKIAFQELSNKRTGSEKRSHETVSSQSSELLLENISALPDKMKDLDTNTTEKGEPGSASGSDKKEEEKS